MQPGALATLAVIHLTREREAGHHYQRWCYYGSALHALGGMSETLSSMFAAVGVKGPSDQLVSTLGSTPVDVAFFD